MEKRMMIGIGVGVSTFIILLVVVVVVAVFVCRRYRRNRETDRRTTYTQEIPSIERRVDFQQSPDIVKEPEECQDVKTVGAHFSYRQSRDPFSSLSGDLNTDSLQLVQAGQGENGGAIAYPPPVGVPPPYLPNA